MNEYEQAMQGAMDMGISDYQLGLFRDYLDHEVTQSDVDHEVSGDMDDHFWDDFRFMYAEYGDNSELMLEAILERIGTEPRANLSRDEFEEDEFGDEELEDRKLPGIPPVQPERPGPAPLPPPSVPGTGRRGGNTGWRALLRTTRRIGRRLFGRD